MFKEKQLPSFFKFALIIVALTLAIAIIYMQTGGHEFLNYDDDLYITNNHNIQAGFTPASLKWAFTTTYASNYHPLTWLSHMLDFQLFGLQPGSHHLVNVLIHLLNTLLLFTLLYKITGTLWRSFMVAALFACHPLHVESVAWASERKDLLSSMFWLLTLISYNNYVRHRGWQSYGLVALCFMAGLLAKPMIVTLPFTLLLLDHWPYNRWSTPQESNWMIIREKIPFFMLTIISCLITVQAQNHGSSVASLSSFSLIERVSNATIAYISYLNKTIWPVNLSIFYPYRDSIDILTTGGAFTLLSLLTYFFVSMLNKKPYLTIGWLWYLGTLIPVIGIVQVGEQAMADRYSYIPLVGIFIVTVWGIYDIFGKIAIGQKKKIWLVAVSAIVLTSSTLLSYMQTGYWRSDEEVFKHAIEVTQKNYLAHFQLGTAYARTGKFSEAEQNLREAISLKPGTAQAYNNLAYVLERRGNKKEAVLNYQKSVRVDPDNAEAHYNLGLIYLRRWQLTQAVHHFQRTLEISPGAGLARKNLLKAQKLLTSQNK